MLCLYMEEREDIAPFSEEELAKIESDFREVLAEQYRKWNPSATANSFRNGKVSLGNLEARFAFSNLKGRFAFSSTPPGRCLDFSVEAFLKFDGGPVLEELKRSVLQTSEAARKSEYFIGYWISDAGVEITCGIGRLPEERKKFYEDMRDILIGFLRASYKLREAHR